MYTKAQQFLLAKCKQIYVGTWLISLYVESVGAQKEDIVKFLSEKVKELRKIKGKDRPTRQNILLLSSLLLLAQYQQLNRPNTRPRSPSEIQ
jgi:peptide subunit release factor 1 (eRF1)